MGDHRCTIKIYFEFHGIEDKINMDINYDPSGCCNMDSRVIEFFENVYRKGIRKYHDEMAKLEASQNIARIEREEKEELKRLKEKYDPQS